MSGPPVTVVESGGVPVTAVETGASVLTAVEAGGSPITLVESGGFPFVVEGLQIFDPAVLFASGEKGAWYDPSDLSTVWQDTAGTVPGAVGQPVARIDDKSGNGFHASNATAANRPILRQDGSLYYLDFDGVNDGLGTASIDFTGTNKMSVFVGVQKDADTLADVVSLSTAGYNTVGAFSLLVPVSTTTTDFGTRLGVLNRYRYTESAAPLKVVYTGLVDGAVANGASPSLRRNGVLVGAKTDTSTSTGNFGNLPLFFGARNLGASAPLNGRIYGLIVRGALTSGADLTGAESWMNQRTGAF